MSKYKIDKNLPVKRDRPVDELTEAIRKMDVGDSMYLENRSESHKFFHRQQKINHDRWLEAEKGGMNYTDFKTHLTRTFTIKKEGTGFRAWRLK